MIPFNQENNLFIFEKDKDVTEEVVQKFITLHQTLISRFKRLENLYLGHHKILSQKEKPEYKPDNRLVVNFAKYIVDNFNGFFIGIPVNVKVDNEEMDELFQNFRKRNSISDHEYELAKMTSIYGRAFELLYNNTDSETDLAYINPKEAFVVYDDTVQQQPLFGVYYFTKTTDTSYIQVGTVYTRYKEISFTTEGGVLKFEEEKEHYFGDVPLIEYYENDERLSTIEPVETLINQLNKVISEKANDVDYFADAYLKILGIDLDTETLNKLRDSRVINGVGTYDNNKIDIDFLSKPQADETQENLIERLISLIFTISSVANITDEKFATQSGIALEYKLLPMKNLALVKERKFKSAFNLRHKMLFNIPTNFGMRKESYLDLTYIFTRNLPENLREEAEVLEILSGHISQETAISTLSIVEDANKELERMDKEKENNFDKFDLQIERDVNNEEENN